MFGGKGTARRPSAGEALERGVSAYLHSLVEQSAVLIDGEAVEQAIAAPCRCDQRLALPIGSGQATQIGSIAVARAGDEEAHRGVLRKQ